MSKRMLPHASESKAIVVLLYTICVTLVLSTNTLYSNLGFNQLVLSSLIVFLCCVLCTVIWARTSISRNVVIALVGWISLLFFCNLSVCLATGDFGSWNYPLFVTLLSITPLLGVLMQKAGLFSKFIKAFTNTACFIAAISLVLWFLGPLFGIITPNCAILNGWTGVEGMTVLSPGYFNLQFEVQTANLLGLRIIRNTSFFAEAPMYSLILCVALVFEWASPSNRRLGVVLVLVGAILSTISTTGYIVILGLAVSQFAVKAYNAKRVRPLLFIVLGLIAVSAAVLIIQLLDDKVQSASGLARIDDFVAGYKAWQNNIIFGNGMSAQSVLQSYMGDFRANNVGFSNSLMSALARGGIVFCIPLLIAWASYYCGQPARIKMVGSLFLFLWVFTNITLIPLTSFLLGFGIAAQFHEISQGDLMSKKYFEKGGAPHVIIAD